MSFRSLSIVKERQNQATVCFGLLALLLNAAVLRTSSFLQSNQQCVSSMRKVAADPEGSLKRPIITHWRERDHNVAFVTGNLRQTQEQRQLSQPSFSFLKLISVSSLFLKIV